MIRRIVISVIGLLIGLVLHAQNRDLDSLSILLKNSHREDTNKVLLQLEIGKHLNRQNPDSALAIYRTALKLAEKLNYKRGIAEGNYGIGNFSYNKGEHLVAREHVHASLDLYVQLNSSFKIAQANNLLGLINWSLGNYDIALNNHLEALRLREELMESEHIAYSLNNIGLIYWDLRQLDKALEYFEKCHEILLKFESKNSIAVVQNNIGLIYIEKGDWEKALTHHNKSLQIRTEIKDNAAIVVSLSNVGLTYYGMKKYAQALDFHMRSLVLKKEINDKGGIAISYYNIAQCYFQMDEVDNAIRYYQLSVELNAELGIKKGVLENNEGLYKLYKAKGNFREAFKYHTLFTEMKDSLLNESNFKSVNDMQAKYETDKKEKEIELLSKNSALQEAEIKQDVVYRNVIVASIMLVVLLAFFVYKRYTVKRDSNNALTELNLKLESVNAELEKLSIVASNTHSGVMIFDKNLDIEWVNEGFTKLSGYVVDDIIRHGKNLKTISNKENIESLINDAVESKNPIIYESLNQMKNGEVCWNQSTLTPIVDEFGDLKKVVIIESDINKIKQAEEIVRQKSISITDSIDYAKKIQDTILLSENEIADKLKDCFVLFNPKDVVSGDFYWISQRHNLTYVAAVDCTGHGVPGAFMSLLGYNYFQHAIKSNKIDNPAELLKIVNDQVVNLTKPGSATQKIKSGMDVSLIILDRTKGILQFAGAHNPLYLVRNNELLEFKGDKMSVGDCGDNERFTSHEIPIQKGDLLYLFSDGYADQVGGPNRKKFYYKPFKELLLSVHQLEMKEQKNIMKETISSWRGQLEQFDDVLVMGIRI